MYGRLRSIVTHATAAENGAPLQVEILSHGWPEQVRPEWDALASDTATPNPFYESWGVEAGRALPEGGGVRLLLAWRASGEGERLAGVLPIATQRLRGLALATENWTQRARALGDPLLRTGEEAAFWRAALPALAREPGHYLRLSALDADSASTRALQQVLTEQERPFYRTRSYSRAELTGDLSSAEHAAAHVRGKVLKEHRRLRSRLAERGELRFDRLVPGADPGPWIDDLFRLEISGWKGRDGVAAAADPATDRCFRDMLTQAHGRGRLDFHRMRVGDTVLSMLANLEAGDEAFQLKIAYDEEWASFSPGVLIEMEYLTHALDVRRLRRVDSCARAGHPMIDRIWPARREIVSLAIPFDSAASRTLCAGMERVRRGREARSVNRAEVESAT